MSVNVKENGNLTKVANNISMVQSNWNDRGNTSKNTCIKNQPATLKSLEEISANTDENALAGANAVKELNESLDDKLNRNLFFCTHSLYTFDSNGITEVTFSRPLADNLYAVFSSRFDGGDVVFIDRQTTGCKIKIANFANSSQYVGLIFVCNTGWYQP